MLPTSSYSLVVSPYASIGAFPLLSLPFPNCLNSGGYLIPTQDGVQYAYSNIDLLVAGLESEYRNISICDLSVFFRQNPIRISENDVVLYYRAEDSQVTIVNSIVKIKQIIKVYKDTELQKCMHRNAPLTFNINNF
jgi:hypothetical protein